MKWREGAIDYKKIDDELRVGSHKTRFTMRVPDDMVTEKNVLLVPGFLAEQHGLNPLAKSLAQIGIAATTMEAPRDPDDILYLAWELESRLHPSTMIVGHSFGGLLSLEAARWAHPGTDLTLLQSAGFGGVDKRRALESLHTDRPDNTHVRHEIKAVRDGIWFAIKRAPELRRLVQKSESRAGVELGRDLPEWMEKRAILFANDRLIDPNESLEGLLEAGFAVSTLRNRLAGHNAPMYHPHHVADVLLTTMTPEVTELRDAA